MPFTETIPYIGGVELYFRVKVEAALPLAPDMSDLATKWVRLFQKWAVNSVHFGSARLYLYYVLIYDLKKS